MSNENERSFLSRIDLSTTNKSYGSSNSASSQKFQKPISGTITSQESDISAEEPETSDEEMPLHVVTDQYFRVRRWAAGITILILLTLERIAFYSLAGNMLLFLYRKPFLWLSYNAMTASYVLTGIAFASSIFGGYLADSCFGRYYTILIGLILYIISYVVLTLLASNKTELPNMCLDPNVGTNNELNWANSSISSSVSFGNTTDNESLLSSDFDRCGWLIYLLLAGVGISVGLVKTNLGPFGAEQVKDLGPGSVRIFFNWFYWCINIGGLVAIGGIAYIQQSTNYGFWLGYLIPTCFLAFALVLFALTKPLFMIRKPTGSTITTIFYIVKDSIRYRCSRNTYYERFQNSRLPPQERPTCLDMAKVQFGGKYPDASVNDVKTLGNIISVFLALVPYWIIYFQMETTFLVQGLHMRLEPKVNETTPEVQTFSIPAAWLTLFDICFLLMFLPLMDRVIYPFLDRFNIRISPIIRMAIGMGFATLAMLSAGTVELSRLNIINSNNETITQIIGNTSYYAADMWIFWQIPQYSLIGLSEVFASVAGLEFAFSLAPHSMQSIVMGLFYFFTGIGSFLGTGLLNAFRNVWFLDRDNGNINYGHLDYYFFLLAGIQFFFLLIFVIIVNIMRKSPTASINNSPQVGHTDEEN